MNALRKLLAITFALVSASAAQATLITYHIDVELRDCEGLSECYEFFEQDTGLTLPYNSPVIESVPVTALFTIDDTALGDADTSFVFDGTGVGMSITIGDLTLFYSSFEILVSDWISITTLDSFNVFPFSNPLGVTTVIDFLGSDLSVYGAIGIPPIIQGPPLWPDSDTGRWQLFTSGDTLSISRVPEPGTLGLLVIGLAGLGLARRSKRTA